MTGLEAAGLPEVRWWRNSSQDATRLARESGAGGARLYAAAVATTVLPVFERHYPADRQPAEAILTARRYAMGLVGEAAKAAAATAAWRVVLSAADRVSDSGMDPGDSDFVAAAAAAAAAAKRFVAHADAWCWAIGAARFGDTMETSAGFSRLLSLYLDPGDWPEGWRTELVVSLAGAVVRNPMTPDPGPLGALADALEDAGVTGWLPPALRHPQVQALVCPGWWVLRSCHPLPTHDPDGREIV